MARIPYPEFAPDFDMPTPIYGSPHDATLLNVFRVLGHSPALLTAVANIGHTQLTQGELSDPDRELVILAAGRCFGADYVWAQHEQLAAEFGLRADQLTALRERRLTADCFDGPQRDLLAFVSAVAATARVEDALFQRVRERHGDRGVVEIIALTGVYFLVSRITTTLDVDIDSRELDSALSAAGHPQD
ncbi:carboxymuconolactone decarboxylase family protein [Streptomyces sp. NPDC018057]|uniref:carboxymuconolactone decarboxylase family protein n=1 Tax=unclassified Streptomyces TaxID=2593676 RepID=UPI0037916A9E